MTMFCRVLQTASTLGDLRGMLQHLCKRLATLERQPCSSLASSAAACNLHAYTSD